MWVMMSPADATHNRIVRTHWFKRQACALSYTEARQQVNLKELEARNDQSLYDRKTPRR